jgi:hypothetical protein
MSLRASLECGDLSNGMDRQCLTFIDFLLAEAWSRTRIHLPIGDQSVGVVEPGYVLGFSAVTMTILCVVAVLRRTVTEQVITHRKRVKSFPPI